MQRKVIEKFSGLKTLSRLCPSGVAEQEAKQMKVFRIEMFAGAEHGRR